MDVDKLYSVIQDQDIVLKKINENVQQKINTILLIGDTGSGKSFLFNWISGAEFVYEDDQLKLVQGGGKNYSAQSNSMQSVTYIPNFNKIDDDHLIIDFPGFKDTKGKYSQLSIKLMFDEIVTKTNVKIAVVLPQPTTKLEERGAHIQDLIKSAFTSSNTQFDSIGLIINQFQDYPENAPKNEQNAIQKIQEQLHKKSLSDKEYAHIYEALSKQIIIMEDTYHDNIQDVLSEKARNSVISRLKKISAITYKPDYQDENQVVGSYIKTELQKIFTQYQRVIQKQKEDAKSKGLDQFLNKLKNDIKQINEIQQISCDVQTQWIKDLLSKLEQSKDKKESQEKFLLIFSYFFKYKESISGYQSLEENKKQLKKRIKQFIEELEEEQKRQGEKQAEEKKRLDEINAKHEREQEKKEMEMELQRQRFEQKLAEKDKNNLQKELTEKDKIFQEELKKNNQKVDEKIKDYEKQVQQYIQEQQGINAEKEKQNKEKEKQRQNLRAKINDAQIQIRNQEKKIEDYQVEQNGKSYFSKDSEANKNKTLKPFQDEIAKQQAIIDSAQNELFYKD